MATWQSRIIGEGEADPRELGKSHQNVLIHYKGDPRRIRDVLGEIDLSAVNWGDAEAVEEADDGE